MLENSSVRVVTLAVTVIFICGLVAAEVAWKTNMQRDIKELKIEIQHLNERVVGKSPNGWHRNDMRLWILETEKLNPGWKAGSTKFLESSSIQPLPY